MRVLMPVPMVRIGVMRMPVRQGRVTMPVAVRLVRRIVGVVRVLVMVVMGMAMLVHHRLVPVLMLVAFGQVQP